MIYKALAGAIMQAILSSAKKEVMDIARSQIIKSQMEGARKAMLAHVAEKFTEEAEHNFSQYIRALGEATVEVEYKGKPGEALITRAQSAVKELESYIEAQNPDGAVIQYLKRRYKEEGIRIITGRLYGGHYVNRRAQGVYEVMNRMGYASEVDKRRPWLTGEKTTRGLEDMLTEAAVEIFNATFEDVDLSSELALLEFTGAGDEFAEKQKTSSGGGFASAPKQARKSAGRKKKR